MGIATPAVSLPMYARSDAGFTSLAGAGSSDGVLTAPSGIDFGANTLFAPAAFLDFAAAAEGANWLAAGGSDYNDAGQVTKADGIAGNGCWQQQFNDPGWEWFIHESINIPGGSEAVTVFKHVKIDHLSGALSEGGQYKGTRLMTVTGTNDAYGSTPKLAASLWQYPDNGTHCQPHYWPAGGGETNTGGDELNIYGNGWNSTFNQGRMNTNGSTANGLYREWWRGKYFADANNLLLRANTTDKWRSVQHNPGMANGYASSGQWRTRHARIVVMPGLAWLAFGNGSTWATVNDLIAVEPTGWASGAIPFKRRGVIPSGYSWMYGMRTDGSLFSTNGLTSFT